MEYNIWILSDQDTKEETEIVWLNENPSIIKDGVQRAHEKLLNSRYLRVAQIKKEEMPINYSDDLRKKFSTRKLDVNDYKVSDFLENDSGKVIKIIYNNQQYVLTQDKQGFSFAISLKKFKIIEF